MDIKILRTLCVDTGGPLAAVLYRARKFHFVPHMAFAQAFSVKNI